MNDLGDLVLCQFCLYFGATPHVHIFIVLFVHMYVCLLWSVAQLVKDTASKGLVLEEDKEKLLQILDEQQFRLSRFRPCLILIRPQACLPLASHTANLGGNSPTSNPRLQSPRVVSPEYEAQA